jgi:lysophospholipase L1-like esterase
VRPFSATVPKRHLGASVPVLLVFVLAGTVALSPAAATGHGADAHPRSGLIYVSLGDSYAVGYQPAPKPGATAGYAGLVASATRMTLANFGCSGATTTSMLHTSGCGTPYGPPASKHAVPYPDESQAVAAGSFIRRHRRHIGLITVSIGGNDISHCATAADPTSCVLTTLPRIQRNVTSLARRLRKAAGWGVPLIGLTYPDVFLGLWVYPPGHASSTLASLSVTAFKNLFNPVLQRAYGAGGGSFLDVTRDTGAYEPLGRTTDLPPFGTVPVAVAHTCELTWYCSLGNIHATTAGYVLIGRRIVSRYRAITP